jgi:hypothetical protein
MVAEKRDNTLVPAGEVRFFARKGLWLALDPLRTGKRSGDVVPVRPEVFVSVKFFGHHKGGRDPGWSCDRRRLTTVGRRTEAMTATQPVKPRRGRPRKAKTA